MIGFEPVSTKSLRFVFEGGAAYYEVEVYTNRTLFARAVAEYARTQIVVAGDLRGHLMGTVSRDAGAVAVHTAEVTVAGETPSGAWRQTSTTGPNGDFEVPLPFATRGLIRVLAAEGGQRAEATFDSSDISTQLTPLPVRVGSRLSLDGAWEFAADPPGDFPANQAGLAWHPIHVPAHWEMEGFVAESGRAVYRKSFVVPGAWRGQRVKLRAEAVYSHAQVWVNGQRAGGHEGGFTPFELDITESLRPSGRNEMLVLVDARSMASEIDNASYFAYFELAGIWQPIEVFAVPAVHVSHLTATTDFDDAYRDAELSVELDVVNEAGGARPGRVEAPDVRSAGQRSGGARFEFQGPARPLGAEDVAVHKHRSNRRRPGTPSNRGSIQAGGRDQRPGNSRAPSNSVSVSVRSRSRAAC